MKKVFLSGSIKIKNLTESIEKRLDNIVEKNLHVILGDAKGADLALQNYFNDREYENVTIYCVDQPRNKVRNWKLKYVETALTPGTRKYFTIKDTQMAKDCDLGFMVWDCKSTGTLNNIIELLSSGKISLVYNYQKDLFFPIRKIADFIQLLSQMQFRDLEVASKKINLEARIELIEKSKDSEIQSEMTL